MNKIYFPYMSKGLKKIYKNPKFSVGSAIGGIFDVSIYQELNLSSVLFNNFLWSKFETTEGVFNYEYLENYFSFFQRVVDLGIPPIVVVGGLPTWAQVDFENGCSPIRLDKIKNFVNLMTIILSKISNLIYVQILNEVDNADGYDEHYGCFGDADRYFILMKDVYELKNIFSNVVFSMGLTSYCNDFFLKYVQLGGTKYVDQINIHFYNGWGQLNPPLLSDEIDAIKNVGISKEKIWITEANLLHDGNINEEYLISQASWIEEQCDFAFQSGISFFSTYALMSNWRNADILNRPAEQTLKDLCIKYNNS